MRQMRRRGGQRGAKRQPGGGRRKSGGCALYRLERRAAVVLDLGTQPSSACV